MIFVLCMGSQRVGHWVRAHVFPYGRENVIKLTRLFFYVLESLRYTFSFVLYVLLFQIDERKIDMKYIG